MVISKILILAANPLNTVWFSLNREVEQIRTTLQSSASRDRFKIEHRGSIRPGELQKHLDNIKPQIVHFSGHDPLFSASLDRNLESEGLVFEDENGRSTVVSGTVLSNLCALLKQKVVCVVLNSCYSEQQAQEIVKHIPYVVGLNREIGDIAARKFSQGFYRAIWDGRSIEEAFRSGINAIELDGIPENLTPVLLTRSPSAEIAELNILNSTIGKSGMSDGKRRRLEQELNGFEQEYSLLIKKRDRLRNARAIENDPATDFKLEEQIKQVESKITEVDAQLESIEMEINNINKNLSQVNEINIGSIELNIREIAQKLESIETEINNINNTSSQTNEINIQPVNTIDFNLERPENVVNLNSGLYIERTPVEAECYEAIAQEGALIRINAPRQMGKSSLMIRVLDRAKKLGYRTVTLNFQSANESSLQDLDTFLYWFCVSVGTLLELPENIDNHWNNRIFDSKSRCSTVFQSYLSSTISSPIALALDDVDRIFYYPAIANDFFRLLRSWYEAARSPSIWENLRLIVVHQEIYTLDIDRSPFNVGVPIELVPFDITQVKELVRKHDLRWTNQELARFMTMLGGHPYLIRLALYNLKRQYISLEKLLETAPAQTGLFKDHLRRYRTYLTNKPQLSAAMKQVVNTNIPVRLSADLAAQLYSMGLILIDGNFVIPRCELYRLHFRECLES